MTPYYNKPNRRGPARHYEEVARATDRPIILYNIPARTALDMPNDLLAELAQIEHVDYVKQANNANLAPVDGLGIYAGNDDILARTLDIGGVGGICVASHIVGERDAPHGRRARRARRDRRVAARTSSTRMGVTTNPIPVKAALNMLGHRAGGLRLPLVEADEAEQRRDPRRARAPRPAADRARVGTVSSTLRVLPLGGLGEIGKNMMVVEYEGSIVVVDVGLRFPTAEMVGIDLVLPDFSYLRERVDDIEGDRRHPRPRGPPRRAAVGAARAEPRHPRLRRPADDGDGALEARRAPAARGRRRTTSRTARSSSSARSTSSSST